MCRTCGRFGVGGSAVSAQVCSGTMIGFVCFALRLHVSLSCEAAFGQRYLRWCTGMADSCTYGELFGAYHNGSGYLSGRKLKMKFRSVRGTTLSSAWEARRIR